MVKLRNPWGKDSYEGDYSDFDSSKWTTALRNELGHSESDTADGLIWMTFDYYYDNFEETYFNKNTDNWSKATYLKINDQSL